MRSKSAYNARELLVPYISGKTVLDLGCVNHSWVTSLSEDWTHRFVLQHAKTVLGLDYLEKDVKKLSQLGYNIRYGNAEDFDLGMRFDVILAAELIEHLENFGGFLESCKKHMNENSKLIITTPNSYSLASYALHLIKKPYANPDHVCLFDELTLAQLLSRHDLKIERIDYLYARTRGVKGAVLWALGYVPRSAPGLFIVASKQASSISCERFCINCIHFGKIEGIPVCAKNHKPDIACGDFKTKKDN